MARKKSSGWTAAAAAREAIALRDTVLRMPQIEGTEASRKMDTDTVYVISPEMLDVAFSAALPMTEHQGLNSEGGDFPGDGALFLPHPITLHNAALNLSYTVEAVAWDTQHMPRPGFEEPIGFLSCAGFSRSSHFHSDGETTSAHDIFGAPIAPLSWFTIGTEGGRIIADQEPTTSDDSPWADHVVGSLPTIREDGDGSSVQSIFCARLLFATLRLIEQKTASESPMPTPSKRGRQTGGSPSVDVRVVNLARRKRTDGETEDIDKRSVEWKSRWTVRMHARRQWYPKLGRHKTIFVGPYVKGPEDKPIKTTPSVQALR